LFLVGYPPFSESPGLPPLTEQILKGLYTFPDEMMCVDPNKRLTMAGVLEHPWLADDRDNTTRVEKIMQPTLSTVRTFKRPMCDEDSAMDESDDTRTTASNSYVRAKRVKH
jgi:serine/threonine protein kinase